MSVLTRKDILDYIHTGKLQFDPALDGFQLQPHAVDLRMGYTFRIPKTWALTKEGRVALRVDYMESKNEDAFEKVVLADGQYFELLPGEYVIVTTLERITMPNDIMAILYPRTSFNRRGLSVDLTGIIDVHYQGYLTIPVRNNTQTQVVRMYPGERMCQVVFEQLTQDMSKSDALRHGLQRSKYHAENGEEKTAAKVDKKVETDFIREGKLSMLKKDYPLI